jgi:hypothetical protein
MLSDEWLKKLEIETHFFLHGHSDRHPSASPSDCKFDCGLVLIAADLLLFDFIELIPTNTNFQLPWFPAWHVDDPVEVFIGLDNLK